VNGVVKTISGPLLNYVEEVEEVAITEILGDVTNAFSISNNTDQLTENLVNLTNQNSSGSIPPMVSGPIVNTT
jgi:hypothetical protein